MRFRVIPVLDIRRGIVVHAVRGERSRYKPIRSVISRKPDPSEVAESFRRIFGFKSIYIADLDAIEGTGNNYDVISEIARSRWFDEVMVDAGVKRAEEAKLLTSLGVDKVIVATETLPSAIVMRQIVEDMGRDRLLLSLDFRDGRLICPCEGLGVREVDWALQLARECGVREIIALELSRVGTGLGIPDHVLAVIRRARGLGVIVGGGIRNVDQILKAKRLGASGVLVATALHTGEVKPDDLRDVGSHR